MGGSTTRQGLLFCICILLATGTASAAFITDKIVVEIRTERFGQGSVLKKLPSGTSVEVLMSDGKYTRVRTTDNITGWVASTFLTNEKPTQLEYLELLSKSKITEAKLRAAEEKLAGGPTAGPVGDTTGTEGEALELLKKEAQNSRWMKVEMMKARDRADQAEVKLRTVLKNQTDKGKQNKNTKQQLAELQTKNGELEKRLAAAILIGEQQTEDGDVQITPVERAPIPVTETITADNRWSVGVKWFFGSLFAALIVGFFAGISWLDKRSRKRHGGFRIY